MIRIYLSCGHVFHCGFLTTNEQRTKKTECPKCGKEVKIEKAFFLEHPKSFGIKKRIGWVEGRRII